MYILSAADNDYNCFYGKKSSRIDFAHSKSMETGFILRNF